MKAFHAPSNRHGPASGGASRHRNACDASNGPHGPPVAPACAPTTNGADPVQTPWHGPDASLPRRPHDIAIAIAPDAGKSESKMSKAARQPARESAPVPKGPCPRTTGAAPWLSRRLPAVRQMHDTRQRLVRDKAQGDRKSTRLNSSHSQISY